MTARPSNAVRTLALSWHPEEGASVAGGFLRSTEVIRRVSGAEVVVVDSSPTIYHGPGFESVRTLEYRLPFSRAASRADRRLIRPIQWLLATVSLVRLGLKQTKRPGIDVIYVPNSEILPCALAAAVLGSLTGRPVVMCNMNLVGGPLLKRILIALHNRARVVTVLSRALAHDLRRNGVRAPLVVTGLGPADETPSTTADERGMDWDGIFVGRHAWEKGIEELLSIWEIVAQRKPGARLVMVGACPPEIARWIDDRCAHSPALVNNVTRRGVVSDEEKNDLMLRSRVLVHPSKLEGWGFVPREALVRKIPVVSWDLPAYRESLPVGPALRRLPLGDIDGFADATLAFLDRSESELEEAFAAMPPLPHASWDEAAEAEWAAIRNAAARR